MAIVISMSTVDDGGDGGGEHGRKVGVGGDGSGGGADSVSQGVLLVLLLQRLSWSLWGQLGRPHFLRQLKTREFGLVVKRLCKLGGPEVLRMLPYMEGYLEWGSWGSLELLQ